MDYTAYFDFNDGVGERGPYSLRTATPDEDYCSESFKRVVSQYSCSMLPDSGFLAAHAVTSGDTFVRILADGSLVFKGLIPPTDSWTSNGVALNGAPDLSDFTFEVLDYSAWLNREVKADDDIAWENQYICNPSLPGSSLAHRLLTLCGISGSLFQPTFSIPAVLRGFALDEGTVIGDALDSLLWQYGYVLRWSVDHFDVSPWLMETPTSSINLNEDVMLTGLKTERVERETDGIEVKWYALKEKNQCLLYMADLPFGNDNQRSGYPIEAGLLWPVEANADETWWDYEDTALASSINSAGSKTKNTDFTQLVITKNHYLEVKTDTGIVAEFSPVFRNKKAKIAYRNPTTAPLDIYYCKVFADVVYRGGENSVCKNTISSPQKTSTITAEFIHDLGYATRLACALAYQYGTACWRSTFNSELRIELGLIGALSDPYSGFSGKVLVIKRTFDPDTGIYSYKAISLAPITINPTASYQTVLPEPKNAAEAAGAMGPQGPIGETGPAGTDGKTTYFHVAYASSADGSTGFNQVSGTYIGTYVDTTAADSTDYKKYAWKLFQGSQGPKGDQGIQGVNGANGASSYLHLKYAPSDKSIPDRAAGIEWAWSHAIDWSGTNGGTVTVENGILHVVHTALWQGPFWFKSWSVGTKIVSITYKSNAPYVVLIEGAPSSGELTLPVSTTFKTVYAVISRNAVANNALILYSQSASGEIYVKDFNVGDGTYAGIPDTSITVPLGTAGYPEIPDDPAGVTYLSNFASSVDGWAPIASSCILSYSDGKLILTGTGTLPHLNIYKSISSASGKTLKFRIPYDSDVINFSYYDGSTYVGVSPKHLGEWLYFDAIITTTYFRIIYASSLIAGTKTVPIEFIYIGTGAYLERMTESPAAWLGQYVDVAEEDSLDPSKYSWSKIQGDAAVSYSIDSGLAAFSKTRAGVLSPPSVMLSANKSTGGIIAAYAGRFIIAESTDGGVTWTNKYTSSANESSKAYTPTSGISALRVTLYEAGGTTNALSSLILCAVPDGSTAPLYWDALIAAPTANLAPDDYYFDNNTAANGGGVIRYRSASTWAQATSAWRLWATAWKVAMADAIKWCNANGGTIADVTAFVTAIIENAIIKNGIIDYLATSTQVSTALCADGVTPRMKIEWDKAILTALSRDKTQQIRFFDSIVRTIEGSYGVGLEGQSLTFRLASTLAEVASIKYNPSTKSLRSNKIESIVDFCGPSTRGSSSFLSYLNPGNGSAIYSYQFDFVTMIDDRILIAYIDKSTEGLYIVFFYPGTISFSSAIPIETSIRVKSIKTIIKQNGQCVILYSGTAWECHSIIVNSDGSITSEISLLGINIDYNKLGACPLSSNALLIATPNSSGGFSFAIRNSEGTWSPISTIGTEVFSSTELIAIDDSTVLCIVTTINGYLKEYTLNVSNLTWSGPVTISTVYVGIHQTGALKLENGQVLICVPYGGSAQEFIRDIDGSWTPRTSAITSELACQIKLASLSDGTILYIYNDSNFTSPHDAWVKLRKEAVSLSGTIPKRKAYAPVGMGIGELGQNTNGYYFKIRTGTGTGMLICLYDDSASYATNLNPTGVDTPDVTYPFPSTFSSVLLIIPTSKPGTTNSSQRGATVVSRTLTSVTLRGFGVNSNQTIRMGYIAIGFYTE